MLPARGGRAPRSSCCVVAGASLYAARWLMGSTSSFVLGGPSPRAAPRTSTSAVEVSRRAAASTPRVGVAAVAGMAMTAAVAATSFRRAKGRRTSAVISKASPQQVPVLDLEGQQIGEETLNFRTINAETANYVVHQVINIWNYQQRAWGAYAKRRGDDDTKKGKKPWKQKGTGRARQGSRYSPHFGRSATNKGPHGLDNKRNKKNNRRMHYKAISTALQSKWRCIKIVDGLEEAFPVAQHYKLQESLEKWTATEVGTKSMLMITRHGYGIEDPHMPERRDLCDNPLYMSGRLIPRLTMRRPRDIDPTGDGLYQTLKGRRIIISRPAFFDLKAKFDKEVGWAWKGERDILVEQLQKLIEEYPMDRSKEIEIARALPKNPDEREEWARNIREELMAAQASE